MGNSPDKSPQQRGSISQNKPRLVNEAVKSLFFFKLSKRFFSLKIILKA
jgi:hypothetical protein